MKASEFAAKELRRVEELKKDPTLQAMLRSRDNEIGRLQCEAKKWRTAAIILMAVIGTLLLLAGCLLVVMLPK